MRDYEMGRRQAFLLITKAPDDASSCLARARLSRGRWATRLFNRPKREFLDGFISGLEFHLGVSK